jgi:hypothetical protein
MDFVTRGLNDMTKRESAKAKRLANAVDKEIESAYYRRCSGIQINIMDISKVFKAGRAAYDGGARGSELEDAIAAFVQTIRQN